METEFAACVIQDNTGYLTSKAVRFREAPASCETEQAKVV